MYSDNKQEKYLLRKAFEEEKIIPDEILYGDLKKHFLMVVLLKKIMA